VVQEYVIDRGKELVLEMHAHASYLMDTHGKQFFIREYDKTLAFYIRIRITPWTGLD
jgi:hypothetical protein